MKKISKYACLIALATTSSLIISCAGNKRAGDSLSPVSNFHAKQYAGEWHEVARLPNFFERDVVAAKATYRVQPDGNISVLNEGLKPDGEMTSIQGTAKPVGNTPEGEAKLEVRFDPFPASLFAGDYWVLDLNDAHTMAIVGSPNRKFLWLLAKDPSAQTDDFSAGLKRMQTQGFDVSQLIVNPKRLK